jgi:hypothetical protein
MVRVRNGRGRDSSSRESRGRVSLVEARTEGTKHEK